MPNTVGNNWCAAAARHYSVSRTLVLGQTVGDGMLGRIMCDR